MHLVTFTSSEGKPGQHWADNLEDAVKFIERVRNTEGVNDTKLYALTEIPLEVKAYYKVEISGSPSNGSMPLPTLSVGEDEAAAVNTPRAV